MFPRCEICGSPIRSELKAVQIDGSVFKVCSICAKLGSPAHVPKSIKKGEVKLKALGYNIKEPQFELRPDFGKMIKQAREKMGLSQDELGRKINEKLSVIKLLESGRLKPDDSLAKKIERFLKIELLVPVNEIYL